jgi:uncharacterized membrane protein YfcA
MKKPLVLSAVRIYAMTQLLYLAIGVAAGLLAGVFGIGGGILIVPALIYLAKFSPQLATGTSLGVLLMPVGILGAWTYYREGNMRFTASLWIGLGLFVGAYFGARLAQEMSPLVLKRSFAVFLAIVAVRMWIAK